MARLKPRETDLTTATVSVGMEVGDAANNIASSSVSGSNLSDAAAGDKAIRGPGLTPVPLRPNRAMRGRPVHICELCQPPKAFTRAEHLRRHQPSHYPPTLSCNFPGCERIFWRQDLLDRHKQKHHEDGGMIGDKHHSLQDADDLPPYTGIGGSSYQPPLFLQSPSAVSSTTTLIPDFQDFVRNRSIRRKLSDAILNGCGLATILEAAASHPALEKEQVYLVFENLLLSYCLDMLASPALSLLDQVAWFFSVSSEEYTRAFRNKSRKLLGLPPTEATLGAGTGDATVESTSIKDTEELAQTQQDLLDKSEHERGNRDNGEDIIVAEAMQFLVDGNPMQIFRNRLLDFVLQEARVYDVDQDIAPLPHSLPNLVEKIWRWIAFVVPESPVPPGKRRIRWSCSCGQRLYDDYDARLDRVALDDLENRLTTNNLVQRSNERTTAGALSKTMSDIFKSSMRGLGFLRTPIRVEPSEMDLPTHNTARTSTRVVTDTTMQPCGLLYLLYCVSVGAHGAKFHQNLINEKLNGQQLFKFLRTVYGRAKTEARWFTLCATTSISLCKFFVDHSRYASIEQHNQSCTQRPSSDCVCLPPKDLVGQEYQCHPVPPNLMPPFGKNYLMHYFLNPDHLSPEQAWTFAQVPKRMRTGLQPGTDAFVPGWGIYFEDGWHFKTIYLLVSLATFISSLIFGVCWSVFKLDVQAAFGITSYWVTIVAMGMGFLALRSTHML